MGHDKKHKHDKQEHRHEKDRKHGHKHDEGHRHGHEEGHRHGGEHGHHEELVELTVTLEEDQVEILNEMAKEYREQLKQDWDLSAVLRVAVGHFLAKMGRIT